MLSLRRSPSHVATLALLLGGTLLTTVSCASSSATTPTEPAKSAIVAPQPARTELSAAMQQRVEERIKTLHAELKITKEQESLWHPVAQTMRDNEATIEQLITERHATVAQRSALDNVKSYQAIAQAHADGMSRFIAAFTPLYNSLSDAQKKAADAFFSKFQQHEKFRKHGGKKHAVAPHHESHSK